MNKIVLLTLCVTLVHCTVHSATIRVPGNQSTIQEGIDAATNGDTVLVAVGTYFERITFRGKSIVVKSVGGPDQTVIDGTPFTGSDSASLVYFVWGESASTVLDGFTLTKGGGTYYNIYSQHQGGAILCVGSSPIIRDCRIVLNSAFEGGGVYLEDTKAVFENCLFAGNSAGDGNSGGGAVSGYFAKLKFSNCVFSGNDGIRHGGAMSLAFSSVECRRSIFYGNVAQNGGAIQGDKVFLDHCTFYGNTASLGAGGALFSSSAIVTNSIIYGNYGDEIYGPATVAYSDIEGGWTGVGNISQDPRLVDPSNGNYALAASSPCIDAADPASSFDPDATRGDIGALYHNQLQPGVLGLRLLDFGRTALGATLTRQIFITNIFTDSISVTGVNVKSAIFSVDFQEVTTIAPAESVSVRVTFSPKESQVYTDSLFVMTSAETSEVILTGEGSVIYAGEVRGVWSKSQSPVIVAGNVVVPAGDSLLIEPGVRVQVAAGAKFTVRGLLLALGSAQDSIVLTQDDPIYEWWSLQFIDADNASCLDYCRIERGRSDDDIPNNHNPEEMGGGVYCSNSSPTIRHCTITDNKSAPVWSVDGGYGGGIALLNGSNAVVESCTISKNTMSHGGGGIYSVESDPIIVHNFITNNHAATFAIYGNSGGGGIYVRGGQPVIRWNTISYNSPAAYGNWGGGIACATTVIAHISDNVFENNSASMGGGIGLYQAKVILSGNRMVGNRAEMGGGIWIGSSSSVLVQRNVIGQNTGSTSGGGIHVGSANTQLINNTIVSNSASSGYGEGGGVFAERNSNPSVLNTIVFFNVAKSDSQISGAGSYAYCDVQDRVVSGSGNISVFPAFGDLDYHLAIGSPCVDAGNPDSLFDDLEDPSRPGFALLPSLGTVRNDMGSYGGHELPSSFITSVRSDENRDQTPPHKFMLFQNYPNPFNPVTEITYGLPKNAYVQLKVFNVLGQEVKTLVDGMQDAGFKSVTLDAGLLPSGIYYYRLQAGQFIETKKLLLMK